MRTKRIVAAVLLAASLALGRRGVRERRQLRRRQRRLSSGGSKLSGSINGAGATFPRPVYQEWAARFKEKQGTTVNYQGIGSGGGIAQFTAGTVDFGATDSAMKDEEIAAAKKKGDPVHIPTVLRRGHRLLQRQRRREGPQARRRDGRRHLPRQDHEVERPGDRQGQPGRRTSRAPTSRSATAPTSRARPSTSPSSSPTTRPSGRTARASTRRSSGRPAPAPRATTASPPASSRPTARSATSSRPTRCRTTSRSRTVKNKAGKFVEPTLESTSAAGEGLTVPDDLRFSAIDAPGDEAYPIAAVHVPARLPGHVQGRHVRGQGQAGQGLARLRARRRPGASRRSCSTRRCPDAIHTEGPGQGRWPDLQRHADRVELSSMAAGTATPATTARSASGRRPPGCRTHSCAGRSPRSRSGVLALIAFFFIRLYGESRAGVRQVRRHRLRLRQQVGAEQEPVRGACRWSSAR